MLLNVTIKALNVVIKAPIQAIEGINRLGYTDFEALRNQATTALAEARLSFPSTRW
jgi:hypothetical protein